MNAALPRLIAFDLDDTLLTPSGELTNRTREALTACHQRGSQITLASGRMLPNMLPVAEALPFEPAIVSYNGAQVNLSGDQPPLFHCPVPIGLAARVIDYAQERKLHLNFYHDDRLFVTSIDDWKARTYREQTGAHLEYEPNYDNFRGLLPTKLLIIDEADRITQLLAECRTLFGSELTLTRSKLIYLEFLHPSVNKGQGLVALCEALNISLAETASFGDSYNDLEMLQATGRSVAVSNALPEVKQVCSEMCGANSEDGVAAHLESWLASGTTNHA